MDASLTYLYVAKQKFMDMAYVPDVRHSNDYSFEIYLESAHNKVFCFNLDTRWNASRKHKYVEEAATHFTYYQLYSWLENTEIARKSVFSAVQ